MNTRPEVEPRSGWVLYDGECRFCAAAAERWAVALRRRGFEPVPLQTPWVRERLGLSEPELLSEMRVLLPDGQVFGGADAVVYLAARFWWAWPVRALACVPGGKRLLACAYRALARRRSCLGGACSLRLTQGGRP